MLSKTYKVFFSKLFGVRKMTDAENNIKRFRKCREIKLKELWFTDAVILGLLAIGGIVSVALGTLYRLLGIKLSYLSYFGLLIFFTTFLLLVILTNLVWCIKILLDCNRLANTNLPNCISECRRKHCKDNHCDNIPYRTCANMCQEIFSTTP